MLRKMAALCVLLGLFCCGATAQETHRYRLQMAGSEVGTASYVLTRAGDTLRTSLEVSMRLRQGGQPLDVELQGVLESHARTFLPLDYRLTIFTNKAKQAEIQVQPGVDTLRATIQAPGLGTKRVNLAIEPGTLILDNNFCLDHYQMLLWRFRASRADSATYPFVVPQILLQFPKLFHITLRRDGAESLAVGDTTLLCEKISASTDAGLTMNFWSDLDRGILIRWQVPAQLTDVRYDFSAAPSETTRLGLDLERYYRNLLDRFYIRSYADLGDWKRLAYLRLRCKLDVLAFGPPTTDTPWQRFKGEVQREGSRALYNGEFAVERVENISPGSWLSAPHPDSLRPYLVSEPAAPLDAPEIRALADSLRTSSKTPLDMVRAVAGWIHRNIRYAITGGDALSCLKSRRGDCGPQSYLAIALLRCAGIPARIAGGLLYTGGRFGQHNWVEVYLGPDVGWAPFDPTTGEVDVFSAAHVTLWRGWAGALNPEPRQAEIDVVEFRKADG